MKKIFVALLCVFLLCNFVSCNQSNLTETTSSVTDSTSQETVQSQPESTNPVIFHSDANCYVLTEKEQQTWKPYLLSTLANIGIKDSEHYIPGSYAIGLMDINFDNVPEVLAAHDGGSMGNVWIEIYDLQTGNQLCFYDAAHWMDSDNIYLCVADKNGEKVILSEGSIRTPEFGWIKHFGVLLRELDVDWCIGETILFAESVAQEVGYYEHNRIPVSKEEYDAKFQQFLKEYQTISQTQIQLIKWEQFDASSREELNEKMADALIGSTQEFVYTCTVNEK